MTYEPNTHTHTPSLPLPGSQVWVCEFCGRENSVSDGVQRVCVGRRAGVSSDDLYLPNVSDDDYQNLEDTLVVFCVDISGSMSVTTEVRPFFWVSTKGTFLEILLFFLQEMSLQRCKVKFNRR